MGAPTKQRTADARPGLRAGLRKVIKSAKSRGSIAFSQGILAVTSFALLASVFGSPHVPSLLLIPAYILYCLAVMIYCNHQLGIGAWTFSKYSSRTLLFGIPNAAFYAYYASAVPEYFPVFAVFVTSYGLPLIGIARVRFWTLLHAVFFVVFFALAFVISGEYLRGHAFALVSWAVGAGLLYFWLSRVSHHIQNLNETITRKFLESKKNRRHLDTLNRSHARDLQFAKRLQENTLPDVRALQSPHLRMASKYLAMESVGGDFFDVVVDGDVTGMFVADVSGHGVSAALATMLMKATFRGHRAEITDPAAVMETLNASLFGFLEKPHLYVSAVYLALQSDGRLLYCSAGHPACLLMRRATGEVVELPGEEMIFLGIEPDWKYKTSEFQLHPGDRLLVYTDGLIEARNVAGAFFGDGPMRAFLERDASPGPDAFLDALIAEMQSFAGGRRPEDDIAALCIDFQ